MRPTVDRADALGYLTRAGVSLDREPVVVLGIRGGLEPGAGENMIGRFDDVICVVTSELCEAFTANTDPSTEIPGRANLIPGLWRYKPGMHHVGKPNEYPAFVQAGPVTVKRFGQGSDTGWFGINLHNAGGVNTTGSEGCQTIIKTEWDVFHALLMAQLAAKGRTEFPYLLVDRIILIAA